MSTFRSVMPLTSKFRPGLMLTCDQRVRGFGPVAPGAPSGSLPGKDRSNRQRDDRGGGDNDLLHDKSSLLCLMTLNRGAQCSAAARGDLDRPDRRQPFLDQE